MQSEMNTTTFPISHPGYPLCGFVLQAQIPVKMYSCYRTLLLNTSIYHQNVLPSKLARLYRCQLCCSWCLQGKSVGCYLQNVLSQHCQNCHVINSRFVMSVVAKRSLGLTLHGQYWVMVYYQPHVRPKCSIAHNDTLKCTTNMHVPYSVNVDTLITLS